jgi:hypothetical protein
MQDAFNLGWKLAAVYKKQASETILDSYEHERKPIGKQISEGAMSTHEIVMGFGIQPEDRLHLAREPGWEWRTVNLVSGLSHDYRSVSNLPKYLTPVPGPQAGDRAPDALLIQEPKRRIYDVFRRPQFSLIVAPATTTTDVVDIGARVRDEMDRPFLGQVSTYLVINADSPDPRFDFDHQSLDELDDFTQRYEIGSEGRLVLVRPDLYIGMACLPSEWEKIVQYMKQWSLTSQEIS